VRQAKCAFISLPDGGIANDPVLLRLEQNRCWLSLADSDIGLWAQGLAYHSGPDVTIGEVDVAPVQIQIQGPVLEAGRSLGLEVIGPCHIRRIEGGTLAFRSDMLVGIEIEGPSVGTYIDNEMIDMYPVFRGGEQVGKVSSACHSPRLEANIGYAMLPAASRAVRRRIMGKDWPTPAAAGGERLTTTARLSMCL
jgi:glycine cleavage system aminomethyltransferase T